MGAGVQYALQRALASGFSATEGMHRARPRPPKKSDDAYILPEDIMPDKESRLILRGAKEDVMIPYMCIGAFSWGDKATWNYQEDRDLPRIKEAWEKLHEAGLTYVDTSLAYGDGESERICGHLFKDMPRDSFTVQTKWMPLPDLNHMFGHQKGMPSRLKDSLENLGLEYVDVYLVHGPVHLSLLSTVAKSLAECVHRGMTKAIGVSNYNKSEMIKMANALDKHGVPLALNQCEYSVIRRLPEVHGLVRECRQRGIVFQAFAPLAEGRLTGKYSSGNEPPRNYRFGSYPMHMLEPTLDVLRQIAEERRVHIAAVALNFCINKGVIPCVGVRSPEQVDHNLGALGWRLTQDEVRRIEAVSIEGKTSAFLQHG